MLATALFDRPPFRHCVAHGIVLGDDGRKMSKRLGNYPEPDMVFDMWGADAMRWFLLSSPILRGQDLVVHAKGIEEVRRQVLNPIWNAWYFLSLYANVDGIRGPVAHRRHRASSTATSWPRRPPWSTTSPPSMDAYDLFARLRGHHRASSTPSTTGTSGAAATGSGGPATARPRSRADKADAYDTLSTVLVTLCRLAAPLLPLLTESVYQGLTGERSVHLADWPAPGELPADPELVEAMDLVRDVCSAGARHPQGQRPAGPAPAAHASPWPRADPERLRPFVGLIDDEVNVKEVVLTDEVGDVAEQVLTLVHAALGPRLGPDTQRVIAAVRAGDWHRTDDGVVAGGVRLEPGEYELVLRPRNVDEGRTLPDDVGVVTLDTDRRRRPRGRRAGPRRRPPRPGRAARRRAPRVGLHRLGDRRPGRRSSAAVETHRAYVAEQTLAVDLRVTGGPRPGHPGHQDALPRRLTRPQPPVPARPGPADRTEAQRRARRTRAAVSGARWPGAGRTVDGHDALVVAVGRRASASTGRAPPVAALPCTATADRPPPSSVMADGSWPGVPSTESGAATVGMSSPGAASVDGGRLVAGTGRGPGAGRCARSEPAGCTCSSTHVSMSLERTAQPVALVLHVPGDGLDVAGQLRPDRLEPRDLLAQVALGVLGHRLGPLPRPRRAPGGPAPRRRPRATRAWASASAWVWSTNFWASSSVRCKVSSLTAGRRRGLRLAAALLLQHACSSWAMRSAACRSRSPAWRTCSWSASASTATRSRYSSTSSM